MHVEQDHPNVLSFDTEFDAHYWVGPICVKYKIGTKIVFQLGFSSQWKFGFSDFSHGYQPHSRKRSKTGTISSQSRTISHTAEIGDRLRRVVGVQDFQSYQ